MLQSMSTTPNQTTIPKIRTYAADLLDVRANPPYTTIPKTPTATINSIPQPTEAAVIPPFHTFDHAPKNVVAAPPNRQTDYSKNTPEATATAQAIISKSSTTSQTVTEALPAVIITDTKHKRFSLGAALQTSLYDWWQTKKEDAKKRKVPKYTVPDAERRKGVIQKATAKTGRDSTADHAAVLSKIRVAKQIPHTQSTPSVTPLPKPIPTPSWGTDSGAATPATDKPSNILVTQKTRPAPTSAQLSSQTQPWESPSQKQVTVGSIPQASPAKIILSGTEFSKIKQERMLTPQVEVAKKIITPIITLPILKTPEPPTTVLPVIQVAAVTPQVTPVSRPKIMPIIPAVVTAIISPPAAFVPSPIIPAAPVPSYPSIFQSEYTDTDPIRAQTPTVPERRFAPPRPTHRSFFSVISETNHLVFISFGVLLFVVVSGLSLRSYLKNSTDNSGTPSEAAPEIYTTFTNSELAPVPTSVATKQELAAALQTGKPDVESLVEIPILDRTTNSSLTPAGFFALLDAQVLFDFKASVTAVIFGNYRGTPWIILTITDKNTALGGMLAWEKTLSRDLTPVFTATTLGTENGFIDGVSGSTDIRMLKNNNGTVAITYGFVTDNTILITGTEAAFLNLATSFRQ